MKAATKVLKARIDLLLEDVYNGDNGTIEKVSVIALYKERERGDISIWYDNISSSSSDIFKVEEGLESFKLRLKNTLAKIYKEADRGAVGRVLYGVSKRVSGSWHMNDLEREILTKECDDEN